MKPIETVIAELKRRYKRLFLTEVPGRAGPVAIVFRPLTYSEFSHISELAQLSDISDDVIKTAVLFPDVSQIDTCELMDLAPGIYEQVALCILDTSGFVNKEAFAAIVPDTRAQAMEIYNQIAVFVCKAFPSYRPHEIMSMDLEDILSLVAKAEMSLQTEFPWSAFFNPPKPKKQKGGPPVENFSDLPVFTPAQLAAMESGANKEFAKQRSNRRRAQPEGAPQKATKSEAMRQKLLQSWGE